MPKPNPRMVVVGAAHVEDVGIGEGGGIAVGRADEEHGELALGQGDAAYLHLFGRHLARELHGADVAQHLLHGAAHDGGVVTHQRQLVGAPEQLERAPRHQVDGRFVAGHDEQDARGQQLPLGEGHALLLGLDEPGQQVVTWMTPTFLQQVGEVLHEGEDGPQALLHGVGREQEVGVEAACQRV